MCPEYPWASKGRHPGFSDVDAYPEKFREFLEALKKAVATDDREGVASLIDFDQVGLSKAEFLRRYDEIMMPCLKESIQCISLDAVAEDYLGAWMANDALLVFLHWPDRFQIIGFTGKGPCYPKHAPRKKQ